MQIRSFTQSIGPSFKYTETTPPVLFRQMTESVKFGEGDTTPAEKPKLTGKRRLAEVSGAFMTWTGASFAAHVIADAFGKISEKATQVVGSGRASIFTAAGALILTGLGWFIQKKAQG